MTNKFLYIVYFGMALLALHACSDELSSDSGEKNRVEGKEISFKASIQQALPGGSAAVGSRAGEKEPIKEGEYKPIAADVWGDWDITVRHKNITENRIDPIKLYKVYSGVQGEIQPVGDTKKWLWEVNADGSDMHIFQAWTEPNPKEGAQVITNTDVDGIKKVDFNAGNQIIGKKDESGNITEYNHHYLNYLIGTSAGPVDYKTNGLYVPLYFRRLVSRIRIISILRIYPEGTQRFEYNMWDIEFPDMHNTGTLDTRLDATTAYASTSTDSVPSPIVKTEEGKDAKGLYVELGGAPNIEKISLGEGGEGTNMRVPIYVPPFDFTTNGKFYVGYLGSNVPDGGEMTYNSYIGDLGKVFLNRGSDSEKSNQKLYAGESMDLMLELKDDEISGMYVYLRPWNEAENKDVMQRPRPGIYSNEDWNALYQALPNGPFPEYLYETDDDGNKVFKIYNDFPVGLIGESTITIPDDCILDGMGHNLSCNGTLTINGNVKDLRINGTKLP